MGWKDSWSPDQAKRIILSSISIREIGVKVQTGKLSIPLPIDEYASRLRRVRRVEFQPVGVETWLANRSLEWSHRDPADRTILATAILAKSPLITSDATIQDYYQRTIW